MDATIPTGVVSFLFTDVESSTRLWESDPDGMAASLALHDQTMRSVIESRCGHIFSTAGDAFAVAFASVRAAVAASSAIQLGLMSADWSGPPIKSPGAVIRRAHLDSLRRQALEFLGNEEAERQFEERSAVGVDEALDRGRRLLIELISGRHRT